MPALDSNTDPRRKHPLHGVAYVDGQPTIIFDTVCAKNRRAWLTNDDDHSLICEVWRDATGWLVGRYIVMPDHIHYFAAATEPHIEFEKWVRFWKSQFTKRFNKRFALVAENPSGGRASWRAVPRGGSAGASPCQASPDPLHLWQTDHWDTRIRSEAMYQDKWLYVFENAVRKGLVAQAHAWPYQGEIFELPWR